MYDNYDEARYISDFYQADVKKFCNALTCLMSCCLDKIPFDLSEVEEIIVSDNRGYDGWGSEQSTEDNSFAIAKLKDGTYAVATEYEDYTGHGCGCGATVVVKQTLYDAIYLGLSREERDSPEVVKLIEKYGFTAPV